MSTTILRGALAAGAAMLALSVPAVAAGATAPAAMPSTGRRASSTTTDAANPAAVFALPRPTGPHPVGTTVLHLVDDSRPDPWVPEEKARELMVSLWYPAKAPSGRRAPYMTMKEAALVLKGLEARAVPANAVRLSRTRTNASLDAAPLGRERGLPLVVLSPGFTVPRSSLTALAEDLASKGYVVAGIDHTYESFGTSLPGGRTATCVACKSVDLPGLVKVTRTRVADVSFVLDRLTGPNPAWKGGGLIDTSRIGMAGHSIGGNSATWTMLGDRRFRAGINMDGTFFIPLPEKGLSRPFLMLGAGKIHQPGGGDTSWGRDWKRMTGWKRWITFDGMEHRSFCDYPLFAQQLGLKLDSSLSGPRTVEVLRAYVGAFFDLHLRKQSRPLLDRASRRYPEVRFWR
ncbi:alpha/beta hydrolase [Nonomuraea sp. NPDC003804]|uniref:alpha/beta hydrolase family protein n=1 Tax=Nonomuraea sp. NPDC003804 TaxID=3154547 RepID=UPI0033AB37B0